MDMRQYRMGLVQTFDQLRFSYLAINEGIRRIIHIPSRDSGYENSVEASLAYCVTGPMCQCSVQVPMQP